MPPSIKTNPATTPVRTLDDAQTVSFQLPLHLAKWLDEHAVRRCATKSQILRDLVLDLRDRTTTAVPSSAGADRIMTVQEAKAAARKGGRR